LSASISRSSGRNSVLTITAQAKCRPLREERGNTEYRRLRRACQRRESTTFVASTGYRGAAPGNWQTCYGWNSGIARTMNSSNKGTVNATSPWAGL